MLSEYLSVKLMYSSIPLSGHSFFGMTNKSHSTQPTNELAMNTLEASVVKQDYMHHLTISVRVQVMHACFLCE